MKIINIRWKICLTFSIIVIYMLLLLIFLSLYVSKTQQVPPLTSQLKPKHNPSKLKITNKPEIHTTQQPLNDWKQSSMVKSDIAPRFLYKGGRKDVKFVIGVPTTLRPERNYVLETIDSLIQRMTPEQRTICMIVVYVGETNLQLGKHIVKELRVKHPKHLMSGLIDVIAPHLHYYPNFSQLNTTLQDDTDTKEVRWWTKRNLDYIYLMSYAQPKGLYYLQLDDNTMANEGFLDYIDKSVVIHHTFRLDHVDFIAMSFSDFGFCGKLFPSKALQSFITYLQMFCDHQPIDWLLQSFVTLQSCRWDSISQPYCQRAIDSRIIQMEHPQFQQMGKPSPFEQKVQQDIFFNRNVDLQRLPHLRDPLKLIASHWNSFLRHNFDLLPGETFIWMYMPQMPMMMEDLISNQYKGTELRIRNHKKTANSLPEFSVELVEKVLGCDMRPIPNKHCGFVMSHTTTTLAEEGNDERASEEHDNYMFYYIKEDSEDTLTWFSSFFGAKDGSGRPSFDWILVYILAICSFYVI
ncbi:hypothetical protein KR032_003742 [Drosophila birchii]|nr:hypothetical protein KR032_003742 [Drosophila birchii]